MNSEEVATEIAPIEIVDFSSRRSSSRFVLRSEMRNGRSSCRMNFTEFSMLYMVHSMDEAMPFCQRNFR